MIVKLIKFAVIGVIGVYIVNETRAGSHFQEWVCRMGDKIQKKTTSKETPEKEIGRIKHEVGQIDGDIDKVKGDLAEANVNVRLLKRDVDDLHKEVKDSDSAVRKHGDVVKAASENDKIQWGFRTVSYVESKEMLMSEVKRHNDLKDRLKARESALITQEQTREIVEQQLQEMLKQKDVLASAVAEMEAEIKVAKVEQIRSKYQNDGSRMANIKSSLAELRKRVMIQREKLRITETTTKSPAADKSVEEILKGIDGASVIKAVGEEVKVIGKE